MIVYHKQLFDAVGQGSLSLVQLALLHGSNSMVNITCPIYGEILPSTAPVVEKGTQILWKSCSTRGRDQPFLRSRSYIIAQTARYGFGNVVPLLVVRRADRCLIDREGELALHAVTKNGLLQAVHMLLYSNNYSDNCMSREWRRRPI